MKKIERTMTDLTWDDMCDLMCGVPEDELPINQDDNNEEEVGAD